MAALLLERPACGQKCRQKVEFFSTCLRDQITVVFDSTVCTWSTIVTLDIYIIQRVDDPFLIITNKKRSDFYIHDLVADLQRLSSGSGIVSLQKITRNLLFGMQARVGLGIVRYNWYQSYCRRISYQLMSGYQQASRPPLLISFRCSLRIS